MAGGRQGHQGQRSQSPNNHLLGKYGDGHSSHSQITKSLNNNKAAFLSLTIPLDKHTVSSVLQCL